MERFPEKKVGAGRSISVSICQGRYESPFAVKVRDAKTGAMGMAHLGFRKEAVAIESIQAIVTPERYIRALNEKLGEPWPNVLVREVEAHARALGFRRLVMARPETLPNYAHPVGEVLIVENPEARAFVRTLRARIERARTGSKPMLPQPVVIWLHAMAKNKQPLNASALNEFVTRWVQKMTQSEPAPAAIVVSGALELDYAAVCALMGKARLVDRKGRLDVDFSRMEAATRDEFWKRFEKVMKGVYNVERHQARMRNFYGRIAQVNGFRREGDWFVKDLA